MSLRAIKYEEIKVGDKIITENDFTGKGFIVFEVEDIDKEDHSIEEKGGLNIYPNDDDQYIVME